MDDLGSGMTDPKPLVQLRQALSQLQVCVIGVRGSEKMLIIGLTGGDQGHGCARGYRALHPHRIAAAHRVDVRESIGCYVAGFHFLVA